MNLRLDSGIIRLRLTVDESETLLRLNQLTITTSWITGDDLTVALTLSADAARPAVQAEALGLYISLPQSAFVDLAERTGRRDAAIRWSAMSAVGKTLTWMIEIDAFRPRIRQEQSEFATFASNLT